MFSDEQTPKPQIFGGEESLLNGRMKTLIKIHFSGHQQTEVFMSPLKRALDCGGKPHEPPPTNPKGLHSKLSRKSSPGKQHRGSWRWFVVSLCWLCRSTPQSAPAHLLSKPTDQQWPTSWVSWSFPSWQLPWLNKNDHCLHFCFHFQHKTCYSQTAHLFRQTPPLHSKVHRGKGISALRAELCAQAGTACITPAFLCVVISSLFYIKQSSALVVISHQGNQNPVTWSVLKHRKNPNIIDREEEKWIWTVLLLFLHKQLAFLHSL